MFFSRDNERYGRYEVDIAGIGLCIFEIGICGFGEQFTLFHDGKEIWYHETLDDDFDDEDNFEDGDDEVFIAYISMPYYKSVEFRFSELRKINKDG